MPSYRHNSDLGFSDAKFKRAPRRPAKVDTALFRSNYGSIMAAGQKKVTQNPFCPIKVA